MSKIADNKDALDLGRTLAVVFLHEWQEVPEDLMVYHIDSGFYGRVSHFDGHKLVVVENELGDTRIFDASYGGHAKLAIDIFDKATLTSMFDFWYEEGSRYTPNHHREMIGVNDEASIYIANNLAHRSTILLGRTPRKR